MNAPINDITITSMVTIPIERYDDLIRKEFAYDYLRKETIARSYISQQEKYIFDISDEEVKEDK